MSRSFNSHYIILPFNNTILLVYNQIYLILTPSSRDVNTLCIQFLRGIKNRYDGSLFVLLHRWGYYGSAASIS